MNVTRTAQVFLGTCARSIYYSIMNTPDDLLCLKDAAKLVPSARGGNRGVHVNTLKRWIFSGRLKHWKVGPFMLVSRAELQELFTRVEPAPEPKPRSAHGETEETVAILKRHGLDKYL